MALSRVFGMSNIAALYANALPDLTLAISRGTATTTTSSEADVSTLESSPTNFINSDFRNAAKISREAANNAISALALLQTVRDAYTRIDALLAALESLADSADDSDVSTVDRAILNQQFSNTRDDIDAIANDTEFHNTAILNTNKTFDFSIGTGGTVMGVGRRLREAHPAVKVIGVEPRMGDRLQGLRSLSEGFRPPLLDLDQLDGRILVDNASAISAAQELAAKEGICAGISAGATLHAARKAAQRMDEGNIVLMFSDGGWKYLPARPWEAAHAGDKRLDDLHWW